MGKMKGLGWKLGGSLIYLTNIFSASTMCRSVIKRLVWEYDGD